MLPMLFGENLFDEFFDNAFAPARRESAYAKAAPNLMKTDVREVGDNFEIDMELPGFKKEQVEIRLENGTLTVSAAKTANTEDKSAEGRYIRRERFTGACSRSFYIGEELEPKDIRASFEDGILRLTVPKAAPKQLPKAGTIAID